MRGRGGFVFGLFVLVFLWVPRLVSAQTLELDRIFSQALNLLESSASSIEQTQHELSESRSYIESLETLSEERKQMLLRQAETLERQSNYLSSINQQQISTSRELIVYKEKLARAMWWVRLLGIILVVWIGLKLIRIFVGIKFPILDTILPRWVDVVI
jgi:ABC-type multidrug transport system fused ATPase/permease subunit